MRVMKLFFVGAVFLTPLTAFAQETGATETAADAGGDSEARMRFELGRRYYERGRFADAAAEFESAIALVPLPALYFNLFLAYRDGGDERAAPTLRLYIGTLQPGERRTQLEARLRVMESGEAADRSSNEPSAAAAPGTSEPSIAPWVVVGAGGLLAIGAVATGFLAMGERAALEDLCGADPCPDGYEEVQSRGEGFAIATDVFWITGAAAIAAGVVWAIAESAGDDSAPRAGLACDGNGCFATVQGEL